MGPPPPRVKKVKSHEGNEENWEARAPDRFARKQKDGRFGPQALKTAGLQANSQF